MAFSAPVKLRLVDHSQMRPIRRGSDVEFASMDEFQSVYINISKGPLRNWSLFSNTKPDEKEEHSVCVKDIRESWFYKSALQWCDYPEDSKVECCMTIATQKGPWWYLLFDSKEAADKFHDAFLMASKCL